MRRSISNPSIPVLEIDNPDAQTKEESMLNISNKSAVAIKQEDKTQYVVNNHHLSVNKLEFANNISKDELSQSSSLLNSNHKKPDVKPKPTIVLSNVFKLQPSKETLKDQFVPSNVFKRQPSKESTFVGSINLSPSSSPSITSPPVKGITITPKTKSFKKIQHQSPEVTVLDNDAILHEGNQIVFIDNKRVVLETKFLQEDQPGKSGEVELRSQGSRISHDNRMEGRRLPSLPPNAFIKDESDHAIKNDRHYVLVTKRVGDTMC